MRQQPTTTISKRNQGKTATPDFLRHSVKPANGDSVEVLEVYYKERIQSFSIMLELLNVLEDAPEIEFLCREIIEGRAMLLKLATRKKYSA